MDNIKASYFAINEIQDRDTPEGVLEVLQKIATQFGVEYFVITGLPLPGRKLAPLIMAKHWPKGWLERYTQQEYEHVDPCAHRCFNSFEPFCWDSVPLKRGYEQRSKLVMDEASEYGMLDGMTVPIHTEDGFTAAVSFSGDRLELPDQSIELLQMSAYVAHGHIRSLMGEKFANIRVLSEREREVLTWSASGKSNEVIATILGISRRTVEEHLKQSTRKLDSVNVKQAIANAIFYNEIDI